MSAKPEPQPERDADFWGDERDLFEEFDEGLDEEKLARAEADIAAGRVVPHEKVAEWLSRVGTPDATPMPEEWLK